MTRCGPAPRGLRAKPIPHTQGARRRSLIGMESPPDTPAVCGIQGRRTPQKRRFRTAPADPGAGPREECSPEPRSPRQGLRRSRRACPKTNGAVEALVPTETGFSQSGSGLRGYSGIPPFTCGAAIAAQPGNPSEKRYQQNRGWGRPQEQHRKAAIGCVTAPGRVRCDSDHSSRKRGRPLPTPNRAPRQRTSI